MRDIFEGNRAIFWNAWDLDLEARPGSSIKGGASYRDSSSHMRSEKTRMRDTGCHWVTAYVKRLQLEVECLVLVKVL